MINFKTGTLSKKQKIQVKSLLEDTVDLYGDFFITKENIRYSIRENSHLLFEGLTKGDKIVFGEEGVIFVDGFSDNSSRKYVKILSKNVDSTNNLLKVLNWNLSNEDLYIKIKKDNFNVIALKKSGFRQIGDRGKEVLMLRKAKNIVFTVPNKDEVEEK
jgi:hypothetical protein